MIKVRLLDLVLVVVVRSLQKNQESCKVKICLSSGKRLSLKNCQKVGIYPNLTL